MFTGIIQSIGGIKSQQLRDGDYRFTIQLGELEEQNIAIGDSIAVSGVCLTVISLENGCFTADVSVETLSRTTLGQLSYGSQVNLELALTPQSRLGGHFVSGHVDGIGQVKSRSGDARSERFVIQSPENIIHYIAEKGSICVEGVSLTVNGVNDDTFDVNIIPHTLAVTTMGGLQVGHQVNLEVDLLARYLERLMSARNQTDETTLSMQGLEDAGFIQNSQ
ncbi:MAG TPA: riboflavin synthase [Crenotrichaceae bacterium]|nr:riboflavin synthase [Crenotrichaceae bacterium]